MISTTRFGWIRLPLLVAGFSLAAVLAVAAQTPPADEDTEEPAEEAAPTSQRRLMSTTPIS